MKVKDKGGRAGMNNELVEQFLSYNSFNGCEAKYHEQILAHVSLSHGICFRPGINCHPERREKNIVEMLAPCGCTIPILSDSTVVCRQPLNDSFVNVFSINV